MSEDKLELARRMAADKTNYRKATWESRITRWFPAAHGRVFLHLELQREPDRPMTAHMTVDQAQAMILDLVTGRYGAEGLPDAPGLFEGGLDALGRVRLCQILKGLGVPEDVARQTAGVGREEA